MTDLQLDIYGNEIPHPIRVKHLTERQRDLLLIISAVKEPMSTYDVGRLYAQPSAALRRLESYGLVERVRRGWWRAT